MLDDDDEPPGLVGSVLVPPLDPLVRSRLSLPPLQAKRKNGMSQRVFMAARPGKARTRRTFAHLLDHGRRAGTRSATLAQRLALRRPARAARAGAAPRGAT